MRPKRGLPVKQLALIFAVFWWAQGAFCLLPGLRHAHGGDFATTGAAHAEHALHAHHGASAQRDPNPSLPEDDSGCEQHCASLSQALAPAASATPLIATLGLPPATPVVQPAVLLVATRSLDSHHGPPPPDLVITNASLRI